MALFHLPVPTVVWNLCSNLGEIATSSTSARGANAAKHSTAETYQHFLRIYTYTVVPILLKRSGFKRCFMRARFTHLLNVLSQRCPRPPTFWKCPTGFFGPLGALTWSGPINLLAFLSESSKIIRRLCGYHLSGRYYLGDAFRGLFKRSRRRGRIWYLGE